MRLPLAAGLALVTALLGACAKLTPSPVCPRCLPQNESTWRPVQDQLEAYNAHDLEKFVLAYTDDVVLVEEPAGKTFLRGKAQLRAEYGEMFGGPHPPVVDVRQRIVSGEWVFDQELTEGGRNAVAAYHVKAGRIVEVRFFPVNPS